MERPQKKEIDPYDDNVWIRNSIAIEMVNKTISDYEEYLKEVASVENIAKLITEVQGDILIRHGVEATTIDLATAISKMILGEK